MAELTAAAAESSLELDSLMSGKKRGTSGEDPIMITGLDGRERSLAEALLMIAKRVASLKGDSTPSIGMDKFMGGGVGTLITGRPEAAAQGLAAYLKVDEFDLFEKLNRGVRAIRDEFEAGGTDEDNECLHYVLHERAGTNKRRFANGVRDEGRKGETLKDFVNHPYSKRAGLREAHVLALRLYTTAAYRSLNSPLRDMKRDYPHPMAATVFFLTDGIRRLRTIAADAQAEQAEATKAAKKAGLSRLSTMMGKSTDLWRGMRNMGTTDEFEDEGGAECAPMSTTPDPAIAIAYGASSSCLLFKIVCSSFMNMGADISYLSAFPEEKEILFPPLYTCIHMRAHACTSHTCRHSQPYLSLP